MTLTEGLDAAVRLLSDAHQRALLRGDVRAADRLHHLVRAADRESEYDRHVEMVDLPIVPRRAEVPRDACLGWWIAHDPHVRAQRLARGLRVDYQGEVVT